MARRVGVGLTSEDAANLAEYTKQMVGHGFDPLPDHDYPLEIEGAGISSLWTTMLPLIRKAFKYGKPLAKKIGKLALGALAAKATSKIAGADSSAAVTAATPGQAVLDRVMREGKSMAVERATQLKDLGIEKTQALINDSISALKKRKNETLDKAASSARNLAKRSQVQASEAMGQLSKRARARMMALRGSGYDPDEAFVAGHFGSGYRFADASGGYRTGVRTAKGFMDSPGAFVSGRVTGAGMFLPTGAGMYMPGSGHVKKKCPRPWHVTSIPE